MNLFDFSIRLTVYRLSINNYSTKRVAVMNYPVLSVHSDINATSAVDTTRRTSKVNMSR